MDIFRVFNPDKCREKNFVLYKTLFLNHIIMEKKAAYLIVFSSISIFLGAFLKLENEPSGKLFLIAGLIFFVTAIALFIFNKIKKSAA